MARGERPLTHAPVLAGAFLFNLGQGVLRPTMPVYLQTIFAANYRMVTWIPTVFGAGKWIANVPTGYLLNRLGRRPLMATGLALIAGCDIASAAAPTYPIFLALRALAGVGWAMFATVATTAMVDGSGVHRRGRAVSVLMMSETSGLLAGSAAGGWLYRDLGVTSPLLFEAGCMLVAAVVVTAPSPSRSPGAVVARGRPERGVLAAVLRTPGVMLMSVTNAVLVAIQTGLLVFLYPLHLVNRASVGPGTAGVLVSFTVLGRLLALWFGGQASDRWGRQHVLVPGLLAYAVLLVTVPSITHPAWLALWSLMIGASSGVVAAQPTALVGDRVQGAHHGVAVGWLRTMADTGQIAGPLLMGALADAFGLSAPFLAASVILAVAGWRVDRARRVERAA